MKTLKPNIAFTIKRIKILSANPPDLSTQLGIAKANADEWLRQVIVAVGAWDVDSRVYDVVPRLIAQQVEEDGESGFPCEVWVMNVKGHRKGNVGPISLEPPHIRVFPGGKPHGPRVYSGTLWPTIQHEWSSSLTPLFASVESMLPKYLPEELRDSARLLTGVKFSKEIFHYYPWGYTVIARFEAGECDLEPKRYAPHFQLCLSKRRDLYEAVASALQNEWENILKKIGCKKEDLRKQNERFPIKQYGIDWSSAESIAEAFGKFVSAVYPVVKDLIW